MNKTVPFFANTPDDTHCFQAAIKMVLKYFEPDNEFSWDQLDAITAKDKELWTWPMAGALWLKDHSYDVSFIEDFDYKTFSEKGEQYLLETMGEEVARAQVAHSNIDQERQYASELLRKVSIEKRIPNLQEIQKYLSDGYLVVCNINAKKLNDANGYVGHFVVITGINDHEMLLHDPGLPPQENRIVSLEQFNEAWAYPNNNAKNIMAFKRRT